MTEQEIEVDFTDADTQTGEDTPRFSSEDLEVFRKLNIDPDTATDVDLLKVAKRALGAESTLVDLKRKAKNLESQPSGEYLTREDLEIEKFLDKNADLAEYKDDLTKYAKAIAKEKGIPLAQALVKAKVLVESDDETIANRQKASKATITGGEDGHSGTYTQEEVAKMPPEKAQVLWAKARRGEIKIK